MLIGLLFVFLLGGGANPVLDLIKQFDKATKHVVVEPDQREAVQGVLKDMSAAIKQHDKGRDQSTKALTQVAANYDATAADYLAVLDAQLETNVAFQEQLVTLHRDLKAKITAEEWAAIVAKSDL